MSERSIRIQKLVLAAVCLALCMVLPFLTGQIPEIGSMLCPMHIPVLLCGFVCGPHRVGRCARGDLRCRRRSLHLGGLPGRRIHPGRSRHPIAYRTDPADRPGAAEGAVLDAQGMRRGLPHHGEALLRAFIQLFREPG